MKRLVVILMTTLLFSCTSLFYNYTQEEFVDEYLKTVEYFDATLSGPFTTYKIKKVGKKFNKLKNQLYKNNDNYERISQSTVKVYSEKIDEYLQVIEDLKD